MKKCLAKSHIRRMVFLLSLSLCVGWSLGVSEILKVQASAAGQSEVQLDRTKPTLNAAVSERMLTVEAKDEESGIKTIFVNGYEFTDIEDGNLDIRLQQFDAGYKEFILQAMDHAGNMSDKYRIVNPYYEDENDVGTQENPASELPIDAQPSKPAESSATVTEYFESEAEPEVNGKEFYTIQTESGKVFYLIIEKAEGNEQVYFLTEIDENDLLNVTTDNSQTLPKNSAALESGIPVTEAALPNNNQVGFVEEMIADTEADIQSDNAESDVGAAEVEISNKGSYIVMCIIAVFAGGAAYYVKEVKKKKAASEDEGDDEEEEELINEDEEEDSSEEQERE